MKEKLFADANFFCALHNEDDPLSPRATELSKTILNNYEVFTSNLVLYETYTVLSMRSSRIVASEFIRLLDETESLNFIWHTKELDNFALSIFEETSKDFSFIDCTIISTMKSYGIKNLLTFDKYFKKLEKKYRFKVIS